MKIELVKQTTKYTGDVYYYVTIDGSLQFGTWTSDLEKAEGHLARVEALAKQYPETITEVLKTIEI